jgi:hypothetical protein
VHPAAVKLEALRLIEAGLNDCEVSRRLGVARTTIREWRVPRYVRRTPMGEVCPRCWRFASKPITFTDADYAELLGLYLGDGHIVRTGRSDRLRLFLDTRYQGIVGDAQDLLQRCFPHSGIGIARTAKGTTTIVSLYSTHLRCLFPQHGAGKKHERRIVLEPWQRKALECEPWAFLRGCIRSDGCVFINRTGRYEYLSYDFKNLSDDIRRLFTDTCDRVGVAYRPYATHVRIYRRASVALMEKHVGRKA